MRTIIGNGLQSAVVNADGQVGPQLRTELAAPGEVDLGTEIDDGFSGIPIWHTVEGVLAFCFARDDGLQGECVFMVERKINTRPARPRQVICILMAEIPLRPCS